MATFIMEFLLSVWVHPKVWSPGSWEVAEPLIGSSPVGEVVPLHPALLESQCVMM